MGLFGRKKNKVAPAAAEESLQKILGEALYAQARVEKMPVSYGILAQSQSPFAKMKELGPTLLEDLGPSGKVFVSYDESEERLTMTLTFSYAKESEEMKLIGECVDEIDLDETDTLPGDITDLEIIYYTDVPETDVLFYAEGVKAADLKTAANSLFGRVFDWLDIVFEAFEDEF